MYEHIITGLSNVSFMDFMLLAVLILMALTFLYIQTRKDKMDLRWLIIDDVTRHPSIHKMGQGLALVVSTWGFITLVKEGRLTEFYFAGYMSVWAAAVAINKYLNNKAPADRDNK